MSLFIIYEAPRIISSIFCPFFKIFTLFHLQFLLYSKNLQQINNARNQCQKLYNIFWLLNFLQRRCVCSDCDCIVMLSHNSCGTSLPPPPLRRAVLALSTLYLLCLNGVVGTIPHNVCNVISKAKQKPKTIQYINVSLGSQSFYFAPWTLPP